MPAGIDKNSEARITAISDRSFIDELEHLRKLRAYVMRSMKLIGAKYADLLKFGSLEPLHFANLGEEPNRRPTRA